MAAIKGSEPIENFIGKRYGKLTVVEPTGETNSHGEKLVRCLCDCGNDKIALLRLIKRGSVSSCGCKKKKTSAENMKKAHEHLTNIGLWQNPKLRSAQAVYRKYSDGNISFDHFMILSQMNCFYCGRPPSNCATAYSGNDEITKERLDSSYFIYNGLDRIDSDGKHTTDNVVPCCADCNYAKLDRSQDDFFSWIKMVHNNHFGNK